MRKNTDALLYLALSCLICIITNEATYTFDYKFYISRYSDVPKNNFDAFGHYIHRGFYEDRECGEHIDNTNFDWKYYTRINKLNITTETLARKHYELIGKNQNLEYCQKLKIGIFLHLYNINLIEEFIEKINYFIKINDTNDFYIKINIPIDSNINQYKDLSNFAIFKDQIHFKHVVNATPYHQNLINNNNFPILSSLWHKLKYAFKINPSKVQIFFTENRGADIGGFLLSIDQSFKQNLNLDYIVKIHTKTTDSWRHLATSILNLRINKVLRDYDYIYNCHMEAEVSKTSLNTFKNTLLKSFNLPYTSKFAYSAGTMFIISQKVINFFKPYNMLDLFNTLNLKDYFHTSGNHEMEHNYELLFPYLTYYMNLTKKNIGYIKR